MSLLVVGSVALDSIETPFEKRDEVLGGSATHFSIAASFFTGVKLVAVVGKDFSEKYIDLLISQFKANANLVAKSIAFLFITGSEPGNPIHIGQT